jgi:ethanolamine ammonia-lyase small subunit
MTTPLPQDSAEPDIIAPDAVSPEQAIPDASAGYVVEDVWRKLAVTTPARIALGRAGTGLPTREVLRFALAHAQARDAVHTPFDSAATAEAIGALGFETVEIASAAPARDAYLRRPDLGRRLSDASRALLRERAGEPVDLAIVVADGLSSTAIHAQAVPFLTAFKARVAEAGWRLAPIAVASQARVALGDEVGELMKARAVVVLIGERPGLSSPDSLGLYLTFAPRVGRSDAERNCISNVRGEGLAYDHAAFKLAWLIDQAMARQLTGVNLKDESDLLLVGGKPPQPRLSAG